MKSRLSKQNVIGRCLATIAIGLFLQASTCGPGNPPPSGLRMRSGEKASEFAAPCSGPSVASVKDTGVVHFVNGPGGGTEEIFSSFTNEFGVDDHPNARVKRYVEF